MKVHDSLHTISRAKTVIEACSKAFCGLTWDVGPASSIQQREKRIYFHYDENPIECSSTLNIDEVSSSASTSFVVPFVLAPAPSLYNILCAFSDGYDIGTIIIIRVSMCRGSVYTVIHSVVDYRGTAGAASASDGGVIAGQRFSCCALFLSLFFRRNEYDSTSLIAIWVWN